MAFDFGFMNKEQIEAVKHKDGPCRVIAGAGSGKTKVLTERIHYLVKEYGIAPKNILAITFTKKAADEMKERLSGLIGDASKEVNLGTFHSFGLKLIRSFCYRTKRTIPKTILDADQLQVIEKAIVKVTSRPKNPVKIDIEPIEMRSFISWQKNYLIMPADELDISCLEDNANLDETYIEALREIYKAYEEQKKLEKVIDFDDMLVQSYWLLKKDRSFREMYQNICKYILVDEFQDTNVAQYMLLKLLAGGSYRQNIFIVGDARQAIYSWRASKVDFILNFEKEWKNAKTIELNDNYRSTVEVVDMSTLSIKKSTIDYPGICRSGRGNHGSPVFSLTTDDPDYEAKTIAHIIDYLVNDVKDVSFSDIAILYRLNAQSRPFEDAFTNLDIPYYVAGSPGFYGRKEIKELLAYLRLVQNPTDFESFQSIANIPKRDISRDDIDTIKNLSRTYDCSIADVAGHFADKFKKKNLMIDFSMTMKKLQLMNESDKHTVADILTEIYEGAGYYDFLKERAKGKTKEGDSADKVEMISSFIEGCKRFSDIDALFFHIQKMEEKQQEKGREKVQLMSLHRSKGLEFHTVFMVGMSDGTLPHSKSIQTDKYGQIIPRSIEEERRLCYVGITRAKERLFLCSYPENKSIFLREIYAHTKDVSDIFATLKGEDEG